MDRSWHRVSLPMTDPLTVLLSVLAVLALLIAYQMAKAGWRWLLYFGWGK